MKGGVGYMGDNVQAYRNFLTTTDVMKVLKIYNYTIKSKYSNSFP